MSLDLWKLVCLRKGWLLWVFPILLCPLTSHADPKQGRALLDSLLSALPQMKEDSAGASLLDNISYLYCFYNPEEGLVYAQKALDLSRKIKWKMGIGRAYNDFGNNYLNQGMYPEALEALFKSLNLSEEIADKKVIAKSTCNIGIIYYYQGNYENAIQYQTLSLKSYREIGSSDGAFFTLGNLGSIYYAQKKYKEALKYMEQAMKIAVAQNDDRGVMMQLTNMASVYSDSGDTKTALMYYLRSLNLAKAQKDIQMTAIAEGNIGDNYLQMAIDSTQKYSSAEREQFLYLAVDYLKKGIIGCKEVNYNNGLLDFSKTLSKVYALQGNYQKALELFQQFTAAKDSTFSIANTEKMAHLETKRAIQLKDKDIKIAQLEVAKERNKRGFFLAGIAFLLGLLILVFRNYSKQRKSNYLIQKEKKKSDDLLLNILPLEVADELKATGTSRAKHYDNVSVLFTDFVDFTGMAESLSPEQLVAELHECFSAFDQIIERHGLEKIKTIGDAYMAVSGLPVADEMHACQAVQAAIEILEFVEARRNNPVTAKPGFRIRMGINSGSVVAGIVGEKKFAFDIWGDTVNIAARMEQHGEAGKINISETTYRFVKNNFYCHSRGMIEAKHKGAVAMYFVVSNRSAIS